MLRLVGGAALAATLSLIPAANLAGASSQPDLRTIMATPAAPATLTRATEFGLDLARERQRPSGLAPGQTAEDFEAWLALSPANRAGLAAFRDYLVAQGVASVVPLWQLARTASSWRECDAEPFESPPADKWQHIATTLKFVRDDVIPRVGEVEALSAYRNALLNSCSGGAPKSAHREFFALDLTPVNKAVERTDMIRSVCAAHARDGRAYDAGLGFYTGRRFHVDSSGFRKWGADGKGATSPCATYA